MKKIKVGMYRKLIAGAVGIVAIYFGVEVAPEHLQEAAELLLGLGTLVAIYAFPNDQE